MNSLTNVEWITCWMSIRYAMGRQTIASTSLPSELVKAYGKRWDDQQKLLIYDDLKGYEENYGVNNFGRNTIDNIHWKRLKEYCNKDNRVIVKVDGDEYVCFKVDDRYYVVETYLSHPFEDIYIPEKV